MIDFFIFGWWWDDWIDEHWVDSIDDGEKKFIVGDGIGKIDEEVWSSCLDEDAELDVDDEEVVRFFLGAMSGLEVEEGLEVIYSVTCWRYSSLSFRCCWALSCNSFSTFWSCSKD